MNGFMPRSWVTISHCKKTQKQYDLVLLSSCSSCFPNIHEKGFDILDTIIYILNVPQTQGWTAKIQILSCVMRRMNCSLLLTVISINHKQNFPGTICLIPHLHSILVVVFPCCQIFLPSPIWWNEMTQNLTCCPLLIVIWMK